jgi:hypothetical protein
MARTRCVSPQILKPAILKQMQLIAINKEVNGQTATGLEIRVIMDDLESTTPVKCYYSYYSADGSLLGEGNLTLIGLLSAGSITALKNALAAAVGTTPASAMLRMWQWGSDYYRFTYRLNGQEENNILLQGDFMTTQDGDAIKAEVMNLLGIGGEETEALLINSLDELLINGTDTLIL